MTIKQIHFNKNEVAASEFTPRDPWSHGTFGAAFVKIFLKSGGELSIDETHPDFGNVMRMLNVGWGRDEKPGPLTREEILQEFYDKCYKANYNLGGFFLQYSSAIKDAFDECKKKLGEV